VKNIELTDEGIKSDEAMVRTKLFSFLLMLISHTQLREAHEKCSSSTLIYITKGQP